MTTTKTKPRVVRASMVLAILVASPPTRIASHASDPDLGPNVTIFDPATPAATIQAKLDAVFETQESSEFGDARYALLFKPGARRADLTALPT